METKKDLFIKIVMSNENGVSINPETLKKVITTKGYFVSITDFESSKIDYNMVKDIKKKAKELNLITYYIGYWRDLKTKKHYLDLSLLITKKSVALGIAKIFNQKAIFDNRKKDVIYC